ncbi:MAG: hypothetical protein SFU56_02115 [Capsulimonadales bacterium]|nr:hypothetical protein [Capsulimonadales bacterium]
MKSSSKMGVLIGMFSLVSAAALCVGNPGSSTSGMAIASSLTMDPGHFVRDYAGEKGMGWTFPEENWDAKRERFRALVRELENEAPWLREPDSEKGFERCP